ncbi:Glu-tRNA(Gln) amidotransferase GatDE subunit E [archaeon SCG-AAA382B04]|nr:Glu-tRNA(Gln) amidotransferase GatDE subunit E [archaeon SCG-AAA382B04]
MDYDEIGLKVGFEFHQQLDTQTKLFCDCPNTIKETEPDFEFRRNLHPTKSELGEIDRAALEEARLSRDFIYQGFEENTCLVEADEEPPHPLNQNALNIALEISELLGAKTVDVVHVMRKIVIDGSNTAGFQRTALISTDGEIKTEEGEVGIEGISLEEESAQKISGNLEDEVVEYNLQRLGVPLIEIGSTPDIKTPKQARKFAEKVGMILRSTGKVKRGIGTIRQDLNISIEEGSRIELKGVQELDLIEEYIEREIQRQKSLLEIKNQLEDINKQEIEKKIVDVSQIFKETDSGIIKDALKDGVVLALKLSGFGGLVGKEIQPDRRLGTEFSDRAKKAGGVGGIFHTDELPKYGITQDEVKKLKNELNADEDDCVIIVADKEEKSKQALEAVHKRAKQCFEGIPEETRKPLENGSSEYMRPLPGSARMYPETDTPPVKISKGRIKQIRSNLPKLIEEKMEEYKTGLGLDEGKARDIAKSKKSEIFDAAIRETELKPTIIYKTLMSHLPELEDEGYKVNNLTKNRLIDLFKLLDKEEISKENIKEPLSEIIEKPNKEVKKVIEEGDLGTIGKQKIREVVKNVVEQKEELINERGMGAVGPLMGVIMKKLDRRADGDEVSNLLQKKIKKKIGRD